MWEVRELARLVWGHLQLRWALFGLEAGQAAGYFGRVAVAVGGVVVAGGLGYLAGWGVIIVWSARRWAGGDVLPPLAVMAGLHVLAALMAARRPDLLEAFMGGAARASAQPPPSSSFGG